jgi:hypothetical protein
MRGGSKTGNGRERKAKGLEKYFFSELLEARWKKFGGKGESGLDVG